MKCKTSTNTWKTKFKNCSRMCACQCAQLSYTVQQSPSLPSDNHQ